MEIKNQQLNNKITTEATPLFIDLKVSILMQRQETILEINKREYYKSKGNNSYKKEAAASIRALFAFIRSAYRNDKSKEEFETIVNTLKGDDFDAMIEVFYDIDYWLYEKGLTKFDNRSKYNRQMVEEANKFKGF